MLESRDTRVVGARRGAADPFRGGGRRVLREGRRETSVAERRHEAERTGAASTEQFRR